jgi:hypothetical protein
MARMVPAYGLSTLGQLVAENRASLAAGDLLDIKPARQIEGKPLLSEILEEMRRGTGVV